MHPHPMEKSQIARYGYQILDVSAYIKKSTIVIYRNVVSRVAS